MAANALSFKDLYLSPEGRINRQTWWFYVFLLPFAVRVVSNVALDLVGLWIVALIVALAVTYGTVMGGIKRLHDRGKSGWWMLLFTGVPVVGEFILLTGAIPVGLGLMLIFGLWGLFELGVPKGDAGPNAYGPDPLGNAAVETYA